MSRTGPTELKPALLPLIVAALVLPIVGAALLAGPAGGLAAGALVGAALLIVAARARVEEPIEVASGEGRGYRLLVVALIAIEEPEVVEQVEEAAAEGERVKAGSAEILVLAPALNPTLSHWASDLRRARQQAQELLAISLARLAAAEIDARGAVGDTDPTQAVEDTLRTFAADEVVLVTAGDAALADVVADIRHRLDRPVRHLRPTLRSDPSGVV